VAAIKLGISAIDANMFPMVSFVYLDTRKVCEGRALRVCLTPLLLSAAAKIVRGRVVSAGRCISSAMVDARKVEGLH
jgi:hypothetical protein